MPIMTTARLVAAPPSSAPTDTRAFCAAMLPKVSRTFAICIRLLPPDLEHAVLVAYLLCRVADTIEDTPALTPATKDRLFNVFRGALGPEGGDAGALREAFAEARTDEELLARKAGAVLHEFRELPRRQREAIRPWVQEMCDGMAEFARRGAAQRAEGLDALATIDDLDRYCYFVAGTVGHMLTELFHTHANGSDESRRLLRNLATSFGLGLQLTNIIKDVADDRRRGWSFVPRQLCGLAGISPEQLQDDRHRDEAHRVMHVLITKAKGHLLDALEYSIRLPRRAYGIRLFCLSSLYFAVRTLRLAAGDPRLLDPAHKVKITRGEVYRTLVATRVVAPLNWAVRGYFRWLAGPDWGGRSR
jgi:farnesyl-diphosphate farnesyltransferase